jgi:hypothetical protein
MLNHISIGVRDIVKTKRFCDAVLRKRGVASRIARHARPRLFPPDRIVTKKS